MTAAGQGLGVDAAGVPAGHAPAPAATAPRPDWLPERVELVEVGLRDGLQNQPRTLPTEVKLELLAGLLDAGLKRVQVASFVHPGKVPQMADAESLAEALPEREGVVYSGLALNRRGVERAAAAGLRHVDVSLSASDAHSRRNAGMGLEEAERHLLATIALARELGLGVRGGVQCAFGCGMDEVPLERVARLVARVAAAGVEELAVADSAGLADPVAVERVVAAVRAAAPGVPLVLHLHDTRGLGLANLMAGLRAGVTRFDTAFGGLGGCPFIPGAAGNVATEDAVNLLARMGVETGVDLDAVCRVSARAAEALGVTLDSRVFALWQRGRAAVPHGAASTGAGGRGPADAGALDAPMGRC